MHRWKKTLPALAALLLAALAPAAASELGIPNSSQPEADLLAAGQPTEEQLAAAAREGYRTIIDLRAPEEDRGFDEAAAAEKAGLEYVSLPVTPATLDEGTVRGFLEAMRAAERPAVVHCATANRVGALYYAWLVLEKGIAEEKALEQAQAAGLKNAELSEKVKSVVAGMKSEKR